MKKFKILLLTLSLCISMILFNSCGNTNQGDNSNKSTKVETNKVNEENAKTISAQDLFKIDKAKRALAMIIDKSYITDSILGGNGAVVANYMVPKAFYYDENGDDFRAKSPEGYVGYDVEKALKLWDEAKKENNFDNVTLEILVTDNDTNVRTVEYIASQWLQLPGLKTVINQQPFKNMLSLEKKGECDVAFSGWGPDYPDPMTFMDLWVSDSPYNYAHFENEEYDKLIYEAKSGKLTTPDKKQERVEAMQKAEKLILDDQLSIIPLFQKGQSRLIRTGVKNIIRSKVSPDTNYKYADTTYLDENGKKVLRLYDSSDLTTANTLQSTDVVSGNLLILTNEGLLSVFEDGKIDYGMAKSYEVTDDGLVYTFHLRDANWENGEPVKAQDFEFAWKLLANPDTAAEYAMLLEVMQVKNAKDVTSGKKSVDELGVKAIDDKTFEVTLDKPVPFFLNLLSMPNFSPINEKFYNEVGVDKYGTMKEYTLANGPFKLTNWTIGYSYGVEKNESYWNKDEIKLDKITYRVSKENSATLNLYENNEIDYASLAGDYVEAYQDNPEFEQDLTGSMFWLILNHKERK